MKYPLFHFYFVRNLAKTSHPVRIWQAWRWIETKLDQYPELQTALEKAIGDNIMAEKIHIASERALLRKLKKGHKTPIWVYIINLWQDHGGQSVDLTFEDADFKEALEKAIDKYHLLNPLQGRVGLCNVRVGLVIEGQKKLLVPEKYYSDIFYAIKQ